MTCVDALAGRLAVLRASVRRGYAQATAQVRGFAARTLRGVTVPVEEPPVVVPNTLSDCIGELPYGGYPALACAGFAMAATPPEAVSPDGTAAFLEGIGRQRERAESSQAEFAADGIALLGVADGLRVLASLNVPQADEAKAWLCRLIDARQGHDPRTNRVRLLAADLLDGGERFGRRLVAGSDIDAAALDLCLWAAWSETLCAVEHPDSPRQRALFKQLLVDPVPGDGEPLRAVAWLRALDLLTDRLVADAVPDIDRVVRILQETQGSFLRWRWEERATRAGFMPARWLIDKEPDVQAFLLAVLYPLFGDRLQTEEYLPGYGLRQGRCDFGIASLKLIIEVKVVRHNNEIADLEAQIADDLAIYFREPARYNRMVVYIYDDRDRPEPEKYPTIRNALKRRSERIVDVVIVQRPSMIPDRNHRNV